MPQLRVGRKLEDNEWKLPPDSTLTVEEAYDAECDATLWTKRPDLLLAKHVPYEEHEEELDKLHRKRDFAPPLPHQILRWNDVFPPIETIRDYVSTMRQQCHPEYFPWPPKMAFQKCLEVGLTLLSPRHTLSSGTYVPTHQQLNVHTDCSMVLRPQLSSVS